MEDITEEKYKRLKEIRATLKMNQSEFSFSIGVDQTYLSQLENGRIGIGSKIFTALIEKHNVSINWLLTGSGSMFIHDEADAIKIYHALEKMMLDVKNKSLNSI